MRLHSVEPAVVLSLDSRRSRLWIDWKKILLIKPLKTTLSNMIRHGYSPKYSILSLTKPWNQSILLKPYASIGPDWEIQHPWWIFEGSSTERMQLMGTWNLKFALFYSVIAVRVTKPLVPEKISATYVEREAQRTKLLISKEEQKLSSKSNYNI